MSDITNIEWVHHTGGPWLICNEVSEGCAMCYARELMKARLSHIVRAAYKAAGFADWETRSVWGKKAPRVMTRGFWSNAGRWNQSAAKRGVRETVFPSLIDWLDGMEAGIMDQDGQWLTPTEVLARFMKTVRDTPNLDWLLLTKRPEEFGRRMLDVAKHFRSEVGAFVSTPQIQMMEALNLSIPIPNVWIGTSVENQAMADRRIPDLVKIPARVRFLSVEPMLGAIDFNKIEAWRTSETGMLKDGEKPQFAIDWVIFGGESGHGARPCNIEWIRDGVRQCGAAGVPCFVKQLGQHACDGVVPLFLKHPKGGEMAEWPEDLRLREFPILT